MAKKKNVFTDDLTAFLDVAIDLIHLLYFVPWQLKLARTGTEKSMQILEKRKKGLGNSFGPATGSSIVDIFHKGEFVVRAPAGSRTTRGDDIMRMASEVEGRFNATVLVSLHEALEVYLKNLLAKMLYQLRSEVTITDKKAFHKKHPKAAKHERTLAYFREYAGWACNSNCSKALPVLRKHLHWSLVAIVKWHDMDWITVARTLGFCRHCIVHDEGRVADDKVTKMSEPQSQYMRRMMKESVLAREQRILPGKQETYRLIEATMSFGYGLYFYSIIVVLEVFGF